MTRTLTPLVLSLALVACRSANPPSQKADAGYSDDAADVPNESTDVPNGPTDVPNDRFDVPDALTDVPDASIDLGPPYDPCATAAIRDLNALGTRTGETTRVLGDNLSVGRMGPLPSPCAVGYTGYQVVHRYTPRATTRLRVSTNDEATDARLDTVVFALSACGAISDGGVRSLGCSDDTGDPPRDHATTFVTDESVTAGAPVYIVVAGFLHATSELFDSQGRFALSVTEL